MRKLFPVIVVVALTAWAAVASAETRLNPAAKASLDRIGVLAGAQPTVVAVRADGLPLLIQGRLSPRATGSASSITKSFVAANPNLFGIIAPESLMETTLTPHALGRTVRLQQTVRGLPVLGAELVATVDKDGVIRTISSSLTDVSRIDIVPEVAELEAADTALKGSRYLVPANREQFLSRLVVLALPGSGKLAWELHFGAVPALLSNVYFYVDAKTGALVRQENRISFYRGLSFETNPGGLGSPATPVEVELDIPEGGFVYSPADYDTDVVGGLRTICDVQDTDAQADCAAAGPNPIWLRNPQYLARNCPDLHELMPLDLSTMGIPGFDKPVPLHMCSEVQSAYADGDGNFLYPWKDDAGAFLDKDPSDKFSEVQMFFHVGHAYDYFMSLMDDYTGTLKADDWTGHAVKPLMATVNFTIPIDMNAMGSIATAEDLMKLLLSLGDRNSKLFAFDNAFFMPGGDTGIPGLSRPFDSIIFGQGLVIDYSWDGDVIYHEFSHSIDDSLTGGGTGMQTNFGDKWGVNPEPGGLSEGFADTFASYITNEGTMGEYAMGVSGMAPVRDLKGNYTCAASLAGEVHMDGEVWGQSMWQSREAAADAVQGTMDRAKARHLYDQAAFAALANFAPKQGFPEVVANVLVGVKELLGDNAEAAAAAMFAKHETDECPRVIGDGGTGKLEHTSIDTRLGIAAPDAVNGMAGSPYTPGIKQYKITVPEGGKLINLAMTISAGMSMTGSTTPALIQMLLRQGKPIEFTYNQDQVEVEDDVLGPFAIDASGAFTFQAAEGQALPAGDWYLMPVNAGGAASLASLSFTTSGAAVAKKAGLNTYGDTGADTDAVDGTDTNAAPTTDAGTDAGTDTDTPAVSEKKKDEGCGCTAVGTSAPRALSLLNILEALF